MPRRITAIILMVTAIALVVAAILLAFTQVGTRFFGGPARATPVGIIPSPTFLPFTPTPSPSPTPVLTARGQPGPGAITANEAILVDEDSGNILYDLNGERPQPMASTTKIMTALLAMQAMDLTTLVRIQQDALNEVVNNNGSTAGLRVGDELTLRDLLYGLMLPSGDDAAIAIADAVGGAVPNFVRMMNLYAARLGLFQTHYYNPDGLTYYDANGNAISGHYTTAYDLARLARYAMSIPLFAQLVSTKHYVVPPTSLHHAYNWTSINQLLTSYPGATGIKTGYTLEAGGCLVFSATRSGHHLLGVVLHSIDEPHRFSDATTLLNWGFGLPVRVASTT
ncbi:MAG TPA: D-alanyl-D-alanine carboxypeptidase family protein [Ktedonobacteraceae bacterium]|nr:D-alanyl-D-alanine carboxypeptidase family protein [Ktedonobacteraceae bacterium]